jgi:solute carrier family 8 (sodium/calcium exchanger)
MADNNKVVLNNKLNCQQNSNCSSDTLLLPILYELAHNTWIQALIYLVLMVNLFIGIAIIAEIFMCSIEKITSATKKIHKKSNDGKELEVIEIPVWNKTVANLSLMALGSSAPEILLATIEVIGNGFV